MLEIHSWDSFFKQADKVQTAHTNFHTEGKTENTGGGQTKFQSPTLNYQLLKSKVQHAWIAYWIRQKYLESSKIILKINSLQKDFWN